jgi:hypothetical protein
VSGKPYPEGVTQVVKALARCDELAGIIRELESTAKKLQVARDEYTKLSNEIRTAVESMDLEYTGNAGFGGRMGWFLAEMRRQIVAEVEKKYMETGQCQTS